MVYYSIAKECTNGGVDPMDLCLVRTFINMLCATVTMIIAEKHPMKDVPSEMWPLLILRCFVGLTGFT